MTWKGTVEGTNVRDILLDTGSSRTMIRKDLVPPTKWLPDQAVTIQCAHGDTVVYPLASVVELTVEGIPIKVEAALSDTLPVAVLLGRDVPELDQLLDQKKIGALDELMEEVMVVTTRSKSKRDTETTNKERIPAKQPAQPSTTRVQEGREEEQ